MIVKTLLLLTPLIHLNQSFDVYGMRQYVGTCGKDHELLHGQFVSRVATSIDNIQCWDWQNDLLVSGKIGYVTVEGDSLAKERERQLI